VEKLMLKGGFGCHYPEKGGLNARSSKTVNCPLKGFILKIIYSLHIILRNEISGEITEHIVLCYIQNVIELQTVLKTDVEQF